MFSQRALRQAGSSARDPRQRLPERVGQVGADRCGRPPPAASSPKSRSRGQPPSRLGVRAIIWPMPSSAEVSASCVGRPGSVPCRPGRGRGARRCRSRPPQQGAQLRHGPRSPATMLGVAVPGCRRRTRRCDLSDAGEVLQPELVLRLQQKAPRGLSTGGERDEGAQPDRPLDVRSARTPERPRPRPRRRPGRPRLSGGRRGRYRRRRGSPAARRRDSDRRRLPSAALVADGPLLAEVAREHPAARSDLQHPTSAPVERPQQVGAIGREVALHRPAVRAAR